MTPFAKKMIIIALVTFIMSVCVYVGFLYEVYRSGKKVQTWSQERKEEQKRISQHTALEKIFNDSKEDREQLKNFVVSHEGVANFLALIENAGRNQGLLVMMRSVQTLPIKDSPAFETLKVDVEVSGSYTSLVNFLPIIESLPYQTEITSVSLNHTESDTWIGLFELQVVKEKAL